MGRGRARAAVACSLGALALLAAGCGAQSHPNHPRPQANVRVSITLNSRGIVVQPARIAFGPEKKQQIPQNQNHPQPPIDTKRPLNVIFVIANQTRHDSTLEIHGTAKAVNSPTLVASSPTTFETELPTGEYSVTAAKVPTTGKPVLAVGPYRASSENDVLLP